MNTNRQLRLDGSTIRFSTREAQAEELTASLRCFLKGGKTAHTRDIEQQASKLLVEDFEDERAVNDFIRTLCSWGGFTDISGRVCKHNQPDAIKARFVAAKAAIEQEQPDLQAAIREVRALNGLGLSFASKHLRMLWPRHCPVLDSVLHEHLGYPLNSTGYTNLARDCRAVAAFLEGQGVSNPARGNATVWFVGDVEAAIFTLVRP